MQRDRDDRLLDPRGAGDLDRELAGRTRRRAGAARPVSTTRPVRPSPTRVRKTCAAVRSGAVSSPWNAIGSSSCALADEDPAVVVVDQQAQLVRDRHPDLADVVRAIELAGERLEHLQMRDRADVLAAGVPARRPLRVRPRRRRRPGSCREPSRSSSPPRRRRRARAGWRRARGLARSRSRPRSCRRGRARPGRGARRAGSRARSCAPARLPGTITANSSPPIRQTTSPARTLARRWSASSASTSSPTAWPKTSLTFLKSSMSTITTATFVCSPRRASARGGGARGSSGGCRGR